jgi:hypothetical protein
MEVKFNKMEELDNLEQNLDKSNEKLNISDVIVSLAKSLNGDDVNIEDCIYKGKKKYYKEIKIN